MDQGSSCQVLSSQRLGAAKGPTVYSVKVATVVTPLLAETPAQLTPTVDMVQLSPWEVHNVHVHQWLKLETKPGMAVAVVGRV